MNASRCCLSVPGLNEHMIDKGLGSGADEVILDLEDSVPPEAKQAARATVAAALAAATRTGLAVRINAVRSPWCHADALACATAAGPARSLIVPKVESAGDLAFIDRLLDGAEAESGRGEPLAVQALIETAAGLANLAEIVTATPRLQAIILGYADLSASLGRPSVGAPPTWLAEQHSILVAARHAGIAAIDGPYLGVDTGSDFATAVDHAAALGFDGKWVIHPRQIDAVTTAFTPTPDQVGWARRVVAALDEAHEAGRGAVSLEGQMIDEALAVAARRTLARVPAEVR